MEAQYELIDVEAKEFDDDVKAFFAKWSYEAEVSEMFQETLKVTSSTTCAWGSYKDS